MPKKQKVRIVVSLNWGVVDCVHIVGDEAEIEDIVFLEGAHYAEVQNDEYRVKNRDGSLTEHIIYTHISNPDSSLTEGEFDLIEAACIARANEVPQELWELQEDDPRPGDYPLGEDEIDDDEDEL